MKVTWDMEKNSPLWYPFYEIKRKDVISFDFPDRSMINKKFLDVVKKILTKYKVETIFKLGLQELGFVPKVVTLREFNFTTHHFAEDSYWCDDELKWVIYACHDGYITVGGAEFISDLKDTWPNLEKYKVF